MESLFPEDGAEVVGSYLIDVRTRTVRRWTQVGLLASVNVMGGVLIPRLAIIAICESGCRETPRF